MKDFQYKKMFWMNVVLSTFYVLTCIGYFYTINHSYRVNMFEILSDFFFVVTPIFTVITFYKNIFVGTSLILNILTSVIYIGMVVFVMIDKTLGVDSVLDWITLLVVSLPFLINVKVLFDLKSVDVN